MATIEAQECQIGEKIERVELEGLLRTREVGLEGRRMVLHRHSAALQLGCLPHAKPERSALWFGSSFVGAGTAWPTLHSRLSFDP